MSVACVSSSCAWRGRTQAGVPADRRRAAQARRACLAEHRPTALAGRGTRHRHRGAPDRAGSSCVSKQRACWRATSSPSRRSRCAATTSSSLSSSEAAASTSPDAPPTRPGPGSRSRLATCFTCPFERTRLLIHDRDSKFGASFDEVFRSEGVKVIHTLIRVPRANAYADALCAAPRQASRWLLILGRRHLEHVLRRYVTPWGA